MKISFSYCEEFNKDFKKLLKKYPSLENDFSDLQKAMTVQVVLPQTERISGLWENILLPIYKIKKFFCQSLKSNSHLRIIFAYDEQNEHIQFIEFIEIYHKNSQSNHDIELIRKNYKWITDLPSGICSDTPL